jgi:hypothetical protein
MGMGAPRPAGATELVALSPGLLDVKPAPTGAQSPQGFPEPPPPPGVVEVLDPADWEIEDPTPAVEEAEPESLDDFAEELPPSSRPEEEMPSSTGTPSLKALTHHEDHPNRPHVDDFLDNMSAAMNGGIMAGAPTIDVSELAGAAAPVAAGPSIAVADIATPMHGARTLPLFVTGPAEQDDPQTALPATPKDGSLSPAALDRPTPESNEAPRERKNVVAPATKSVPPSAAARRPSGLAAPLLLALAAAAGFLIWKRSASHAPPPPTVEAERPVQQVAAEPSPAPALAPGPTQAEVDAAMDKVAGAEKWSGGPNGVEMNAIFLAPVPITKDNLNVVIDAGWVAKDVVCQGVTAGSVAACN